MNSIGEILVENQYHSSGELGPRMPLRAGTGKGKVWKG